MRIAVDVSDGTVYATPEELRKMADALEARKSVSIQFMELSADEEFDEGTLVMLREEEFD